MGYLSLRYLGCIWYNFKSSSDQAAIRKLADNLSEKSEPSLNVSYIKSFIIPAGKQIKIPRKKTIARVCVGSLNLSETKKKLNIIN